MEPNLSPAELVAQSEALLLDFDGPVCDVYSGVNPGQIAAELAAEFGLDVQTSDPLDIVRQAVRVGGPVDDVHTALTVAEVAAVACATETPGLRRLLYGYARQIAIVSNNATEAIETWLAQSGLRANISAVVGRRPRHLKPDPATLFESARAMQVPIESCVFIGDSLTDIEAARLAGCQMIALANKPRKQIAFKRVGHILTIDNLDQLHHPAL